MTNSALRIDLCGIPFSLTGRGASLPEGTARRYRGFHAGGPAAVRLAVTPDGRHAPRPYMEPEFDRLAGGRWRIRRHDFDGTFDPASGRGSVRAVDRPTTLDSYLRVLLTGLLLDRGGMLVHAASLRFGARALLFPGPSGRGKSTLAAKAGRSRILCDEISCLTGAGALPVLRGTPFWGEFREGRLNAAYPLAGILFLDRKLPPGVHPVRTAEAFRRMLECVMFFASDTEMNRRLLASLRAVLEAVPLRLLSYPIGMPWGEVIRMIRREIPSLREGGG